MLTMIGKRLTFAIPSLIGVVIVTFVLTHALPGDPAAYFAGPPPTQEAIEQIRRQLGLDKTLIEQFFNYLNDLAQGDLGNSLTTGQPVADRDPLTRLPASLELTLLRPVVRSARSRFRSACWPRRGPTRGSTTCAAAPRPRASRFPTFFTGLLLVYIFYFLLGWRRRRSGGSTCSTRAADRHRPLPDRQPARRATSERFAPR